MLKTCLNIFVLLLFVFAIIGCEKSTEPEIEPKLVINAELKAGELIDSVFVSWTADITEYYNSREQRASGAMVKINGFRLNEYPSAPGVYYASDPDLVARGGEQYHLEVIADHERAAATTTVPLPFQFTANGVQEGDTLQYVPGDSWFSEAFFTLEWYGYSNAPVYRIVSDADTAIENNFIEDDRDVANIFKGEEEDRTNPAIWWVGDQFVRINWMFFNYTGWHDLVVSAMDSNYYEYRQGLNFNQFNGQNFNRVVENGYGIFASSASDTIPIYVVE